jgi:hypothetical protein
MRDCRWISRRRLLTAGIGMALVSCSGRVPGIIAAGVGNQPADSPPDALPPGGEDGPEGAERVHIAASRLMEVAIAIVHYTFDREPATYPPAYIASSDHKPLLSWRVAILPYLGEEGKALYRQFKLDEPWDSRHNKALLLKMPEAYSPVGRVARTSYTTCYHVFRGERTPFKGSQGVRRDTVTDGHGQTIMVIEGGAPVPWTRPRDLTYGPNEPLPELGGQFQKVFLVAYCSGAVQVLPKNIDRARLRAAITRDAGDDIGAPLGHGPGEALGLQ